MGPSSLLRLIAVVFIVTLLPVPDPTSDRIFSAAGLHAEDQAQNEWRHRSLSLAESRDWYGLLDLCRDWTNSRPQDGLAWAVFGNAHLQLMRYNDAVDAYRRAVRIDPKNNEAWHNLGASY